MRQHHTFSASCINSNSNRYTCKKRKEAAASKNLTASMQSLLLKIHYYSFLILAVRMLAAKIFRYLRFARLLHPVFRTFIANTKVIFDSRCNSAASFTIAVRIYRIGHFTVSRLIGQQCQRCVINQVFISAN